MQGATRLIMLGKFHGQVNTYFVYSSPTCLGLNSYCIQNQGLNSFFGLYPKLVADLKSLQKAVAPCLSVRPMWDVGALTRD